MRIKQAWQALRGTLEPEVRMVEVIKEATVTVYGTATVVELYLATDEKFYSRVRGIVYCGAPLKCAEWDGLHFPTCEAAFAACPGATISKHTYWQIEGKFYVSPKLIAVQMAPKPKRAKGAK
jgi:hypothetical protein